MAIKGDFFAAKREWSRLKDQILGYYLTPYLGKITNTGRPTWIVDCFAGKGRFGDGSEGSPLAIARHITAIKTTKPWSDVKAVFIEKKYSNDLKANLVGTHECEIVSGEYEEWLSRFLTKRPTRDCNYFFFVDPYGVKHLTFNHFSRLKQTNFASTELLLNLNTTGFLREGCRLLKMVRMVPEWAEEFTYEEDGKNTTERWNNIADGDYWQTILNDFQTQKIDFRQAEECFSTAYAERLRKHFKFVVHIPIREKTNHLPKYRLLFATDHYDGLFLMCDGMNSAWNTLLTKEDAGQLYLFDMALASSVPAITKLICDELATPLDLKELLIRLIRKHGIRHTPGDYQRTISAGESTAFNVTRMPPKTPTGQRPRSMDYTEYAITVETLPQQQELLPQ